MKIYGAGLAGLLAGAHFQRATIFESGSPDQQHHKAVLRFRTPAVGDAVGVEFRRVRVNKGLWLDGRAVAAPTIQLANWYSLKVLGRLADRSVWKLDAADRFIAPEDFLAQLAHRCAGRVVWGHAVTPQEFFSSTEPAVSTLPMSLVAGWLPRAEDTPKFQYAPIVVRRWRIPDADVFQTVYFPSPATSLYRASITGNLLIAEYASAADDTPEVFAAFGLMESDCEPVDSAAQRFGKIAPIDDAWRKRLMFRLTQEHGVYSLGRFGCWRNVLLDDVLHDISVIKKLMNTSGYDRHRSVAK